MNTVQSPEITVSQFKRTDGVSDETKRKASNDTRTHTHARTRSTATGRLRNVTVICTIKLILFYYCHVNARRFPIFLGPRSSTPTVERCLRETGEHSVLYHQLEYRHL